jgi:hypothetical protein
MSDTKNEGPLSPNDPAYYAPRESKGRTGGEQSGAMFMPNDDGWRPRVKTEGPSLQPLGKPPARRQDSDMFNKAVAQAMKEARANAPIEAPAVLRDLSGRRVLIQNTIRFSIAVAIAAGIATLLVMAIPSSQRPATQENLSLAAAWQTVKSSVVSSPPQQQPPQPARRTPTLAAQDGSGFANDSIPLGIHVGAPPLDGYVLIAGLSPGAQLTSGRRVGTSDWRVPAAEISGVSVIPPDGFAGQMLVTAELRDGTGITLASSATRLIWRPVPVAAPPVATPAVVPAVAPPVAVAVAPAAVVAPSVVPARPADIVRSLDPREIAGLIKRGQDLLAAGDVQSARLVLLRGAEARDGRAALLVGQTYDPVRLRQFGAAAALGDVAQARLWYQRAKEFGEPDAQRQLDAMALSR